MHSDCDTSIIQEFIPNSTKLSNDTMYYYLYDYKTEILGKGKLINKIKESISGAKVSGSIAIDKHVKTLKSFIKSNIKTFNTINIVAHSLGGIVTMKLLIELKKDIDIENKLETILLYGVPLKGSNEPQELKKYLGNSIPAEVLKELTPDSSTITSLNQKIERESKYLKHNFRILYIKGNSDSRIIEVNDAYIEHFGSIENVQGGHSEIIAPKNINEQSFIYFKTFLYEHLKEKLTKEKEQKKIMGEMNNLSFTPTFLEFLQNVDILTNAHPDKEKVRLDDIYVYPKVERYYSLGVFKKGINSKHLIDVFKPNKLLIAGESQSGKTSLCKKIIQELKNKKLIPIYLSDEKTHMKVKLKIKYLMLLELSIRAAL